MNGSLAGLVSVTAGCACFEPWAALVVGMVAGWLFLFTSHFLIRVRIDDAVDAIPVHLAAGAWGVFSTGLLSSPRRILAAYGTDLHVGWFYSLARGSFDASLLACQVCGMLFILGWVFFLMFPFFVWLNYMGWFRADSLEELVGLDISYHGGAIGSGNDEVKSEYIEAYNRRRGKQQEKQQADMEMPYPDQYDSQHDAAMEAVQDY